MKAHIFSPDEHFHGVGDHQEGFRACPSLSRDIQEGDIDGPESARFHYPSGDPYDCPFPRNFPLKTIEMRPAFSAPSTPRRASSRDKIGRRAADEP